MQKLLLLHGALGSGESLEKLAALLRHDFEVHSLTFKGHGESELPQGSLTIPQFANEVRTYLAQHDIDSVNIFGYSMGGYVGLYLCRHFPETVRKLFTLATKIEWTPENAAKDAAMLNPAVIKQKIPQYASALERLHGKNWEALMEKTAQMMLDLGQNPVLARADFQQIATPVLISVGDKDAMVSIEETANAYRALQQAQLLVLPGTPHPVEKADVAEVAHQLRRFMHPSD